MTPAQFHAAYRLTADKVSAGTGIDPIVLLAQWANETSWGTSWAGAPFNLGNIENNGVVVHYSSLDEFARACIATFHNGRYDAVLAAKTADAQLAAIVASPWSAGHYGGSLQAFYSPLEVFELTPQEHGWLQEVHASLFPESADQPPSRNYLNNRLDAIVADIKAIPGGTVDLKPVLAAIANVQASLAPIQAGVTGIKAKTDKDLA